MISLLITYIICNTFEDAIGNYGNALNNCSGNVSYLDGMHDSTFAYTITTNVTNLTNFNVNDVDVSNVSFSDYEFVIHEINVAADTDRTDVINRTLDLFNTSYNAEFHIKFDYSTYAHTIKFNESSRNTGPLLQISRSTSNFINTVSFSGFFIYIYALTHPIIYSEYGTKEYTGIRLINTNISASGSNTDTISESLSYIIGGASISLVNVYFESILCPIHVVYATKFLSIRNTLMKPHSFYEYKPECSIIYFNHTSGDDDNDTYVSIAGLVAEPDISSYFIYRKANYSWDYLLDIDVRNVNVANMCGINYHYGTHPLIDINRYGLNYSSYSLYNFSGNSIISHNVNLSSTNTEYLRNYIIQMIKPLAKQFDVSELRQTVSKYADVTDTVDELSSDVESINETMKELSSDVETVNETLEDLSSDVESINETVKELSSDVETVNESMDDLSSDIENINETVKGLSSNVESISETVEKLSGDVKSFNETIDDLSSDMVNVNNSIILLSNTVKDINKTLNTYIVTVYNELKQKIDADCDDCSIFDLIDKINSSSTASSSSSSSSTPYVYIIVIAILSVVLILSLFASLYLLCRKKPKQDQDYERIN